MGKTTERPTWQSWSDGRTRPVLLLLVAWGVSGGLRAETVAGVLPDDTWTRGNWPGRYGTYAYVLFGAKSPQSLTGGPGWPILVKGATGDPKDHHRAWLSLMNTAHDDRALLVPELGRRIASVWDDHGEVKPFNEKTGLFIDVDVPEGRFLVSLYFFEIDWIQYRDYQILAVDREADKPVLETHIDHFCDGKYKRFVFDGPVKLRLKILTGRSPNAVCSGLFLDGLAALMQVPNWVTPLADIEQLKARPQETLDAAVAVGEETLSRFDQDGVGAKDYLTTEGQCLASSGLLESENAPFFFKNLMDAGTRARKRLARFARISLDDQSQQRAWELQYCWARALLDIPARKEAVERIAAIGGSAPAGPKPAEAAPTQKAREEADKLLEAGVPDPALQRLRELTKELISKGDLAGATAILDRLYRSRPESLTAEDHFLYGSGLLFAEDFAKAEGHFQEAIKRGIEKRLEPWAFANGAACLTELKKFVEAEQMVQKLEKAHPDSLELALATLQLGRALALAKDYPKARDLLEKVAGQKGSNSSLREEAKALLKTIESGSPNQ